MSWKNFEKNPSMWKIIWFALFSFFLFSVFGAISSFEFQPSLILAFMNLVGLYGLAFEKRIWSVNFWKGYFWLAAIAVLAIAGILLAVAVSGVSAEDELPLAVITVLIGSLFISLLIYAIELRGLYLYAFEREEIWLPRNA
ncbi:hypothetical protein [Thiosocius teredinicola]|uniref:hypothetical protein n=1 Tax=Thiosocius teredinicola TaxID=1973002 RepID=UPI000F76DDE8